MRMSSQKEGGKEIGRERGKNDQEDLKDSLERVEWTKLCGWQIGQSRRGK